MFHELVKEVFCFSGKSKNKNQGLYYLYLEAVSVINSKAQASSESESTGNRSSTLFDLHTFSQKDLEFVVKFSEEHGSDVFRQILHSFCPSIYGHELVKGTVRSRTSSGAGKIAH
jgi:DNA helicase MCM8